MKLLLVALYCVGIVLIISLTVICLNRLGKQIKDENEDKCDFICNKCGNVIADPKEVGSGTGCVIWFVIGILSVFFAFFQIVALVGMVIAAVGLIVSFSGRKKYVCPSCGQTDCLIPSDSPQGRRLIRECEDAQYGEKKLCKDVEEDDVEKRFVKLARLHECGAITDTEYEEQRRRMLESL